MVLIIFLVIIASICNAIMDITSHKYAWSTFSKYHYTFNSFYWDPSKSWRNKYINGDPNKEENNGMELIYIQLF